MSSKSHSRPFFNLWSRPVVLVLMMLVAVITAGTNSSSSNVTNYHPLRFRISAAIPNYYLLNPFKPIIIFMIIVIIIIILNI